MSTYSAYNVPPFSHPKYHERSCREKDGHLPCAICGKPTNVEKAKHWAVVIDGGARWGDESSPDDGGHMGTFPVGVDCHRKHAVQP